MRVVPLFETLDDLSNAPQVMAKLFATPWYKGDINQKQEVMLGYSDSAKDAGRLAAAWAQYTAQEQLVQVAVDNNVDLSLFHGKGGTASRGGDPSTMRGKSDASFCEFLGVLNFDTTFYSHFPKFYFKTNEYVKRFVRSHQAPSQVNFVLRSKARS